MHGKEQIFKNSYRLRIVKYMGLKCDFHMLFIIGTCDWGKECRFYHPPRGNSEYLVLENIVVYHLHTDSSVHTVIVHSSVHTVIVHSSVHTVIVHSSVHTVIIHSSVHTVIIHSSVHTVIVYSSVHR